MPRSKRKSLSPAETPSRAKAGRSAPHEHPYRSRHQCDRVSRYPARIIDAALDGIVVPVICPSVSREYHDVVTRPKFMRWDFPPVWLTGLIDLAYRVDRDPPSWPLIGPDPDDLIFLALAHVTGATLVTGNTTDFPKRIRKDVTVLTPGDYIDHLARLGHRL